MKRLVRGLCLWALFLPALPGSAPCQYMYVDTDGDGEHTDADVIHPTGTTTLDLWFRTDSNRDGSAATCASGDGELSITGYEFNLRAVNGTVAWGAFTNRVAEFPGNVASTSSTTELRAGATGSTLPPGSYLLATVLVSVASGTPNISIVPRTSLPGSFGTGFGSQCSGSEFTNTLHLGVDWFDVDGAAFEGIPNRPPVFVPAPDLVVLEGTVLNQPIFASDDDGDHVTFTKLSGPAYLTITTAPPDTGITTTGTARLAPSLTDAGTAVASVQASDGIATALLELHITVLDQNRSPLLDQPEDMVTFVGQPARQDLHASDPDGGFLAFTLVEGPPYVSVLTIDPASPATGRVELNPGSGDAGSTYATVAAGDGLLRDERTFAIQVHQFAPTAPLLCRPYDMTVAPGAHAEQTLMATSYTGDLLSFFREAGPAFADVTTVDTDHAPQTGLLALNPTAADRGNFTVTVGVTDGTLRSYESMRVTVTDQPIVRAPTPDVFESSYRAYDLPYLPQSVSDGDLNEDGLPDLVIANQGCGITLYFGMGAGQFGERRDIHTEGEPRGADVGDLDADGHLDVAVATGFGNHIIVFSGDGTGALTPTAEMEAGPNVTHVAIGDLNRDGIPDLVGANENAGSVSVYLGQGARSYASRRDYDSGSTPCYTNIIDLNHDGILDVAETTEGLDQVSILIGLGDGSFLARVPYGPVAGPTAIEAGDFDEDGNPDLVVPSFHGATINVLFSDPNGTFPRQSSFECGIAPWSVCVSDLNGDAHDDIASANTADNSISILLGHGDGTFEPQRVQPAGVYARYVIAADLSGDGKPDLAVTNEGSGTVMILIGNGDGSFGSGRHLDTEAEPMDLSLGDLNGDGRLDIAAAVPSQQAIRFLAGQAQGAFAPAVMLFPGGTAQLTEVSDATGDGVVDLMVPLPDEGSIAIYPGGPGFGVAPPVHVPIGMGSGLIVTGDWNRDGHPDLAVGSRTVSLLYGDGAGGFGNLFELTPLMPAGLLRTGDLDGDGITDLIVGQQNGFWVYWGDGTAFLHFSPVAELLGPATGFASGDFDQDGRQDLAVTVGGNNGGLYGIPHGQLALYTWNGGRGLPPTRIVYPAGPYPRDPAIADFNGDGKTDLLVGESGGGVGFFPGVEGHSFGGRQDYGAGILPFASDVGDVDGDGRLDVVSSDFLGKTITILRNLSRNEAPPLAARAFPSSADQVVRLRSNKPSVCVQVEPAGGAFQLEDVDVASVRLRRVGSNAEPIAPIGMKRVVFADTDRNGVAEMSLCFAKDNIRQLFADVRGAQDVPVALTGALSGGRRFEAPFTLHVMPGAGGPPLAARVAPNPMNPAATLTYTIDRPGPVRVTIFDVHGRTVATLLDSKSEEPGEHKIQFGEGAHVGGALASGIYFYRVETRNDHVNGRFAVLK